MTSDFEVQIGGKTGIAVTYQDGQLEFVVPSKVSLSLSNLLSEIPDLSSVIKKTSHLPSYKPIKTLSVAASLDQIIY